MGHAVVEISSKFIRKSSSRVSTKNAWAKYVRQRWPANTLGAVQAEWDLTEGEARGVLYAQASQPTIDKIMDREDLRRPCGGFRIGLEILAIKTGTALEDYIAHQAEEARRERTEWEAEERRLAILQARLAGLDSVDGGDDQSPRSRGSAHEGLGPGPRRRAVEHRSFNEGGKR